MSVKVPSYILSVFIVGSLNIFSFLQLLKSDYDFKIKKIIFFKITGHRAAKKPDFIFN